MPVFPGRYTARSDESLVVFLTAPPTTMVKP